MKYNSSKFLSFCLFGFAALNLGGCGKSVVNPEVEWELVASIKEGGCAQRFTVRGMPEGGKLIYTQLPRDFKVLTSGDTLTEICASYYSLASSRFGKEEPAVIDMEIGIPITNVSPMPESFHAVLKDGSIIPVETVLQPIMEGVLADGKLKSRMLPADSVFRLNERLAQGRKPGVYDIIPSFKSVIPGEGEYRGGRITKKRVGHGNPEYYRISVRKDGIEITGASEGSLKTAERVLTRQLLEPNGGVLPCAEIEDWPDYSYRGLMVDISRNYLTPEVMNGIVERMADYRMNRLQFHFSDDEGWRLEIPGLPELTEVGGRRGYTLDSKEFLPQAYSGDADPDAEGRNGTGSGWFTRKEFVDFLKHCNELGITVIPEVESPGHARSAIKAMEARARKTGDNSLRLIVDGDTSKYLTAQDFRDNLMNPAAPGAYLFMERVAEGLKEMYAEAGLGLPGIHIGGDEVPEGAWDGSREALAMAADAHVNGKHGLQGEFVRRVAGMYRKMGIPVFGWQDICTGYDEDYNREVAPAVGGMNCWVSSPENNIAEAGIRDGYPVILTNVDYFYLDMAHSRNPEEAGLYWGGYVDELKPLEGTMARLCPDTSKGKPMGVSAALWGECVRGEESASLQLYPKLGAVAERAWNAGETYTAEDYSMLLGEKELPRLEGKVASIHMRQPGIRIANGVAEMNSPYTGGEIRYTLDGSVPGEGSALYRGPVAIPEGTKQVRARLFRNGGASVQTVVEIE